LSEMPSRIRFKVRWTTGRVLSQNLRALVNCLRRSLCLI